MAETSQDHCAAQKDSSRRICLADTSIAAFGEGPDAAAPGSGGGPAAPIRGEPTMPAIVFLNQKGGVGKTSTCHHLSGALARKGQRVLLVDNDPQASLTQGLLGPPAARAMDPRSTIAACYRGDLPFLEDLVMKTPVTGVDLIPGSRGAARFNTPEPHLADHEQRHALDELLREAAVAYDQVLIDCPPNLHLCSYAALAAADGLVVPLQPEDYGAQGLGDVLDSIALVRAGDNPGLAEYGYLITMKHARKTLHQHFEEGLREAYGDRVFRTCVPNSIDFPEAIMARKPITEYKPRGAASKAMLAVADELLERIASSRCSTETAA